MLQSPKSPVNTTPITEKVYSLGDNKFSVHNNKQFRLICHMQPGKAGYPINYN